MSDARLIINSSGRAQRGYDLRGGTSVGRAPDNTICIDEDGVSRYHAIIEERADGHWLYDLGSRNGTAVNGRKIAGDCRLTDGDVITIGGGSSILFQQTQPDWKAQPDWTDDSFAPENSVAPVSQGVAANQANRAPLRRHGAHSGRSSANAHRSFLSWPYLAASGLLIILGAGVAIKFFVGGCGKLDVTGIQAGAMIQRSVSVSLSAERPKCIERVIYEIDGVEIERSRLYPFTVSIDPARAGASGEHELTVRVVAESGSSPSPLRIPFKVGCAPPQTDQLNARMRAVAAKTGMNAIADFDQAFVSDVAGRVCEFREVASRAPDNADQIENIFNSFGLSGKMGVILFMTQRSFADAPGAGGAFDEWRMPEQELRDHNHIRADEGHDQINKPERAAQIAAAYSKDLRDTALLGLDPAYIIASFGLKYDDAYRFGRSARPFRDQPMGGFYQLRNSLPECNERVIRFFAIGISMPGL